MREELKKFILEKVKANTNPNKPYFVIRWTGLAELCQAYGYNVVELIDELVKDKKLKKALLQGKKTKMLAVYLPEYSVYVSKKTQNIMSEFEKFLKNRS